jgi:hypothetical protein
MRGFLLFSCFLLMYCAETVGQSPVSLFETLYAEKEVKITLTYPFDSLYRAKRDEIEATIHIETSNGFLMKDTPMLLNLRGKFRRMKCDMPPLMLNFKKSTLRNLKLSTVDEIKLVTHCLTSPEGQENLEEERICYQLYESLTPYAYRTIWITVEYRDASNPNVAILSTGFLLEPDKDISSRLGLKEKKVFNVAEDSIHFQSYSNAVAFNFMIGNRDWSVISSRNAKLFYDSLLHQYIVIPYDFDYANIVGATYRRETLAKAMDHPFDRMFEGEYFNNRTTEILRSFHSYHSTIINTVQTAENTIDSLRRKKIKKYIDEWFAFLKKAKPEELRYGLICPYKGGL